MNSSKLGSPVVEDRPLDEQAIEQALIEAKVKEEAELRAKAEAEAKAAYDASILIAKSEASALTSQTAPIISNEVSKARNKSPWLRAEVSNSKARIESAIKELESIPDANERASRKASIDNELKTLKDWQTSYPVNKEALRKADVRSALTFGYSKEDAEAWADDHEFLAKREASKGVL